MKATFYPKKNFTSFSSCYPIRTRFLPGFNLGNKLAITISDTGIGMDEEIKQQIFNKFYQGDTALVTAGSGVGLAIVAKVVALHGGTITVESAVGGGSRFIVYLPKK
jgi:signal transduction histidine kinase